MGRFKLLAVSTLYLSRRHRFELSVACACVPDYVCDVKIGMLNPEVVAEHSISMSIIYLLAFCLRPSLPSSLSLLYLFLTWTHRHANMAECRFSLHSSAIGHSNGDRFRMYPPTQIHNRRPGRHPGRYLGLGTAQPFPHILGPDSGGGEAGFVVLNFLSQLQHGSSRFVVCCIPRM